MVTHYYKELYTDDAVYHPFVVSHAFPKLGDDAKQELRRM